MKFLVAVCCTYLLASAVGLPQKEDEKKAAAADTAADAPATRGHFGGGFGGAGFGGRPHGAGFGGRPHGSGFGGRPHGAGFGGRPHGTGFGGRPHGAGFGGRPHVAPSTCRFWCKTPEGRNYCCENNNEAPKNPVTSLITKPGYCPVPRAECPLRGQFGGPQTCSADGGCVGSDRCCFDRCLSRHVCKQPLSYNPALGGGLGVGGGFGGVGGGFGGGLGGGFGGGFQG